MGTSASDSDDRTILEMATALAARRPLLASVAIVLLLLIVAIIIFRPSYDTNDDPMMSLVVAGQGVASQPDEHMVFTHFLWGALLKQLYSWAPVVPWYGVYLLTVHACAHIVLVYMILKHRLGWPWMLLYLTYAAVVGLRLLCALQFTTTAFLAAQSGILLGWFAFQRGVMGDERTARRSGIAAAAFVLISALIRWHVFALFLSLAVPTACVLTWVYRQHGRMLLKGSVLTALVVAGVAGISRLNDVYYRRDPNWREFYHYNELRARINDLGWVYYSPETADVFPKVGWSVNDFGMILSWFYDDPSVYNGAKLQELLDAYPWKESRAGEGSIIDLFDLLVGEPQIVPLLVVLPLLTYALRRNRAAQMALLLTCIWAIGLLCVVTIVRKPPPPRIYLPVLSFPAALALFLATSLPVRGSLIEVKHTACPLRRKVAMMGRLVLRATCVLCAAFGVSTSVGKQFVRCSERALQRESFYGELARLNAQPDRLFICWGASFPFELLDPLDNLRHLRGLKMVQFGWMQQCPFHAEMKRRFGVQDFPRQLPDRPDITLICDPACLTLMSNYIREHHGREVQFERVGSFVNATLARASIGVPSIAAGDSLSRE